MRRWLLLSVEAGEDEISKHIEGDGILRRAQADFIDFIGKVAFRPAKAAGGESGGG